MLTAILYFANAFAHTSPPRLFCYNRYMENTTTIVDAVGKDTLIVLLVLFAGVLYWAFKPRWDKRHSDKNDTDLNL